MRHRKVAVAFATFILFMFNICQADFGFSLDGSDPSGGTTTINQVQTLQKPQATGPLTTTADDQQKIFKLFYDQLATYNPNTDTQGRMCYKNLFYAFFKYYWAFSRDTATINPFTNGYPLGIDQALSGPGTYAFMAFTEDSYPRKLLNVVKDSLIQYIRGRTKQFNSHMYACGTANNFINFTVSQGASQPYTGELAQLDALWKQLTTDFQKAFTAFKGSTSNTQAIQAWTQTLQNEFAVLANGYYIERDHAVVNWYVPLLNELANRFNGKQIQLKNYSYQVIPNVMALDMYNTVFQEALNRLIQAKQTITIGWYTYSTTQAATQQSSDEELKPTRPIIYNDSSKFLLAVNRIINMNLGDIGAFVGQVAFEKASELAAGKQLPQPIVLDQPNPLTGSTDVIPTFFTYGQTTPVGIPSEWNEPPDGVSMPITSANITAFAPFEKLRQGFMGLMSVIQGTMNGFGFNQNNYGLWSNLVGKRVMEGLQDAQPSSNNPKTVQEQAVKDATSSQAQQLYQDGQKTIQNTTNAADAQQAALTDDSNSNEALNIFNALIAAGQGYSIAAKYYNKASQTLAAQSYNQLYNYIMQVLKNFSEGVQNYLQADKAPLFADAQNGTMPTTQGDYLHKASDAFGTAATQFELLNSNALVNYTRKLSAQLAIQRYVSILQGYVQHYGGAIKDYIFIALKSTTVTQKYNGKPVTDYFDDFNAVLSHFDLMLGDAITSYQEELAFYFGLRDANSSENQEVINQLQAALQIFSELQKACAGLYRCISQDGKVICSSNELATDFIQCFSQGDSNFSSDDPCLGADNYVQAAAGGTLSDVIKWVLFASHRYLLAQPHFEAIDGLFKKYGLSKSGINDLPGYTQIQPLFEQQGITSFSEFFYLHQAHTYFFLGQRLFQGLDWDGNPIMIVDENNQQKQRNASPVCILLYFWARALYAHAGFTEQVANVDVLINSVMQDLPKEWQVFVDGAQTVRKQAESDADDAHAEIYFEEALAYYITAYLLLDKDSSQKAVEQELLTFISSKAMKPAVQNAATNTGPVAATTVEPVPGYVEWIDAHIKSFAAPSLVKLWAYYRGYLVAFNSADESASSFLDAAQQELKVLSTKYADLVGQATFKDSDQLTDELYEQKVQAFEDLISLNEEITAKRTLASIFKSLLKVEHAQDLAWPDTTVDIHQMLGDLYSAGAGQLLLQEQTAFATGGSYNQATNDAFQKIIDRYNAAAGEYAWIGNQTDYIKAKVGITNTVAFQAYSSIIPVYQFSIDGLSNSPDTGSSIPHPHCSTTTKVSDAMDTYTTAIPLYLYRYQRVVVPAQYMQAAEAFVGKTADKSIIKALIGPMYNDTLTAQVRGGADITSYVEEFTEQLGTLMDTGVSVCGKTVKASFEVVKVPAQTKDGSPYYYINQYNVPLAPLPRFSGELNTAYQLYSDGPLKLYEGGSIPITFAGQTLLPANNADGRVLVRKGIFNTYLAQAVPYGAQVAQNKKSAGYQALSKLTPAQKITTLLTDKSSDGTTYSSLYQAIQDSFQNLLAIYGALEDFVNTFGSGSQDEALSASEKTNDLQAAYQLEAEAYLEWATVSIPFLIGDPTNVDFKNSIKTINSFTDQVAYYAGFLNATGQQLAVQAKKLGAQALETAGDELVEQDLKAETTTFPTKSDVYPKPVPGFDTLKRWKDAWSFYTIGAKQITNFFEQKENEGKTFPELNALLKEIRTKIGMTVSKLASYYLARFGYNAYQQLKCKTICTVSKNVKKAITADTETAIALTFADDLIQTSTRKTIQIPTLSERITGTTADSCWITDDITKVGTISDYPKYLYPYVGSYPKVAFKKDAYGNRIRYGVEDGADVYPFGLLTQEKDAKTSQYFQGVAAIWQPTFQTILKSGQIGAEQQSINNFLAGGGSGNINQSISNAYTIMKNDALNAVYFYQMAVAAFGDIVPPATQLTADELKGEGVSTQDLVVTQYIAHLFSKQPAFDLTFAQTDAQLPIISVQAVQKGTDGAKDVERFYEIQNFTDQKFAEWHPLSLSNPQHIYPPTLQYWASQPTFGPDVYDQLQKWLEVASAAAAKDSPDTGTEAIYHKIAATWANELQYIARFFYWNVYLPGVDYQTAQTDINAAMSQLSNQSFVQAQEYVG